LSRTEAVWSGHTVRPVLTREICLDEGKPPRTRPDLALGSETYAFAERCPSAMSPLHQASRRAICRASSMAFPRSPLRRWSVSHLPSRSLLCTSWRIRARTIALELLNCFWSCHLVNSLRYGGMFRLVSRRVRRRRQARRNARNALRRRREAGARGQAANPRPCPLRHCMTNLCPFSVELPGAAIGLARLARGKPRRERFPLHSRSLCPQNGVHDSP